MAWGGRGPDGGKVAGRQSGPGRPTSANLLLRQLHGYAGLFTAPALLFFASTGVLQVLGLHQAHAGYTPPAAVAAIGMLHKDQVLSRPKRHRPADAGGAKDHARSGAAHADGPPPPPKLATTFLKAFTILAAGFLIVSTLFGVWMGLQDRRRRVIHAALLLAGFIIPGLLILGLR
jgi:hypothetical protein